MSLYRNTVWGFKGYSEYTKAGYEAAAKSFNNDDLNVDLSGKVAIVTGANSGIGKEIARQLGSLGATVHMLCRDLGRAEDAKSELLKEVPKGKFVIHKFDASLPKEILNFSHIFKQSADRLDILVNNAGTMENEKKTTPDGFDFNFATNTLGTFILTESLIDLLAKTKTSRVVTVSSGGMLTQKLNNDYNFSSMGKSYDGTMAYAQNKRQQVELTNVWAQKYPSVRFYSMHPGWTDTPGVAKSLPGFYRRFEGKLRTVAQGADTAVWAAASNKAYDVMDSGSFLQDRAVASQHLPLAWTKATAEQVEQLYSDLKGIMSRFQQ